MQICRAYANALGTQWGRMAGAFNVLAGAGGGRAKTMGGVTGPICAIHLPAPSPFCNATPLRALHSGSHLVYRRLWQRNPRLTKRVTTLNPRCASASLTRSRHRQRKAPKQDSGQRAKPNFLPSSTKPKAAGTAINHESTTTFAQGMDRPEMAHKIRQAIIQNGRAVPPRGCDQVIESC